MLKTLLIGYKYIGKWKDNSANIYEVHCWFKTLAIWRVLSLCKKKKNSKAGNKQRKTNKRAVSYIYTTHWWLPVARGEMGGAMIGK